MHPDLSPHLHTPECIKLIEALHQCHQNNTIGRFVGKCNSVDTELNACLKRERQRNSAANRKKAAERQKQVREDLKLQDMSENEHNKSTI